MKTKKPKFVPMDSSERNIAQEYIKYLETRRNDNPTEPIYIYSHEVGMIVDYIRTLENDIHKRNEKINNQKNYIKNSIENAKK